MIPYYQYELTIINRHFQPLLANYTWLLEHLTSLSTMFSLFSLSFLSVCRLCGRNVRTSTLPTRASAAWRLTSVALGGLHVETSISAEKLNVLMLHMLLPRQWKEYQCSWVWPHWGTQMSSTTSRIVPPFPTGHWLNMAELMGKPLQCSWQIRHGPGCADCLAMLNHQSPMMLIINKNDASFMLKQCFHSGLN